MLPTIDTVLYATDLAPESAAVFRTTVALARRQGARIVLLHVMEPFGQTATSLVRNVVSADVLKEIQDQGFKEVSKEIHRQLHGFCEQELGPDFKEEDLVSDIRIIQGPPAATIVAQAGSVGAGLIVLGLRVHSGLEKVLLGSVGNKVVQQSRIPVLLVPVAADD